MRDELHLCTSKVYGRISLSNDSIECGLLIPSRSAYSRRLPVETGDVRVEI